MPEVNGLDILLELTREFLYAKVIAISGVGGERNVLGVAKLLGARQTFKATFQHVGSIECCAIRIGALAGC